LTRKPVFGFVDFTEDEENEISWCPRCLKVKVYQKLGPRIYPDNEPLPYDSDQWYQCYRCGKIVPSHERKEEPQFGPVIDAPESPFDVGSKFESVDKRKKKKRNKLNEIDDKDIQREINQGNQVNVIQ